MKERGFGYKRDLAGDPRDRLLSAHPAGATPILDVSDVDMWEVPAKNQGGTSSCVGNGWAGALRRALALSGVMPDCPELSARWCYRGALNIDGSTSDEGTYVRSAARVVQQQGAASEAAMPFSEEEILAEPTAEVIQDAFDRRGQRGYYRVADGDADGVFRALSAGMTVVAGWDVSESFVGSDGLVVFDAQRPPIAGGHCMAIVGHGSSSYYEGRIPAFRPPRSYTRLARILGSWGGSLPWEPRYGYSGRIFATPEFVAQATDIWALDVKGEPS